MSSCCQGPWDLNHELQNLNCNPKNTFVGEISADYNLHRNLSRLVKYCFLRMGQV